MENAKNNPIVSTVTASEKTPSGGDGSGSQQTSKSSSGGSKLKRAFSMSRNPFQSVSRRTKKATEKSATLATATAMTNAGVVTSEQNSINSGGGTGRGGGNGNESKIQGSAEAKSGPEKKILRRLSVKKFINRIAQQMTYGNLTVSEF